MSTIAVLTINESGANSLIDINNNFAALNADKQEKGTGVAGHVVAFGSSNVLEDTGFATPASAFVGLTDTQTLTNKTLSSPTITNKTSTGTDAGVETLQNKTIVASVNSISGITEAMQTLANNTTNNVTTSAHGYAPILPNDATKYLDGTGAWSKPTALTFKGVPVAIPNASTVSFTHGLGKTPTFVQIIIIGNSQYGYSSNSTGTYDGTNYSCISIGDQGSGSANPIIRNSTSYVANIDYASSTQYTGTITTLNSTTVTITWAGGSPPGGHYEAICIVSG